MFKFLQVILLLVWCPNVDSTMSVTVYCKVLILEVGPNNSCTASACNNVNPTQMF